MAWARLPRGALCHHVTPLTLTQCNAGERWLKRYTVACCCPLERHQPIQLIAFCFIWTNTLAIETYNTDSITMHNVWLLHPWLWDSAVPQASPTEMACAELKGQVKVRAWPPLSTHEAVPPAAANVNTTDVAVWSTALTMHCTQQTQLSTHKHRHTFPGGHQTLWTTELCPLSFPWYLGTRTHSLLIGHYPFIFLHRSSSFISLYSPLP